jgi:hypothetical protein
MMKRRLKVIWIGEFLLAASETLVDRPAGRQCSYKRRDASAPIRGETPVLH